MTSKRPLLDEHYPAVSQGIPGYRYKTNAESVCVDVSETLQGGYVADCPCAWQESALPHPAVRIFPAIHELAGRVRGAASPDQSKMSRKYPKDGQRKEIIRPLPER